MNKAYPNKELIKTEIEIMKAKIADILKEGSVKCDCDFKIITSINGKPCNPYKITAFLDKERFTLDPHYAQQSHIDSSKHQP